MKFTYKGHNYVTRFTFGVRTRLSKWFGAYKWPVTIWVNHGECCHPTFGLTDKDIAHYLKIEKNIVELQKKDRGTR